MSFFINKIEKTDRFGDTYIETRIRKDRIITVLIAAILIILLALSVFTIIPTGHTGVVTSFGKVQNYTLDAGPHLKAPWHKVIKMDNRIQKETIELSCFSSDIQEVSMVYTINYQLNANNAMNIYSTVGKKYYDTLISPAVAESVKVVTAQYSAEELISNRAELAVNLEADLSAKLISNDIILTSTSIEDMDFTDAFTNAVEEKQVAQQNKLKAETQAAQKVVEAEAEANVRKINADAEAYELITKANAEAEANALVTQSLTPAILEKMYYETWNGTLPSVITDNNSLLNIPVN